MTNNPKSDSAIHQQLTAYLDGELDDDETRDVEQRLIDDAKYRSLMQDLQKTWDMLDMLPAARAGNSFTQSTMELVISDATKELTKSNRRFWTWPIRFGAMLALTLTVFGCSFAITRLVQDTPNRRLYNNLHVIEEFDQLQKADSIEFLDMLIDKGLFEKDEFDTDEDLNG